MNIANENPVMVFKREYNGNVFYSVGLSKKNQDGSYTNGYMPCQFKKEVAVEDKTKIYIKKAWLTFYLKDKETKPYIFISDFITLDEAITNSKPEQVQEENKTDLYAEFSEENQTELSGLDLPF